MHNLFYSLFWFTYRFVPGFSLLAQRHARISQWKDGALVARAMRRGFFCGVYPQLSVAERQAAQKILMGDEENAYWARHHEELEDVASADQSPVTVFPPPAGDSRVGGLDFMEAFPLFNYLDEFLRGRREIHVIQIGTCSGKEIAWFSGRHPQLRFTGTDLYDPAVEAARTAHQSANLGFLQAAADNIHLAVAATSEPEVIVFTSGAALYIYPETMPRVFRRLAQTGKTVHVMTCEPNLLRLLVRQPRGASSEATANMGYDHDYRGYAEQAGFATVAEINAEPYAGGKFPVFMRERAINFGHFLFTPAHNSNANTLPRS